MMKNKALFTSNIDYWETPQYLFDELNKEFNFTLDPCSTDKNCKCKKHYTIDDDGLKKDWQGETVFCNPPYSKKNTALWVEKCFNEAQNQIQQ